MAPHTAGSRASGRSSFLTISWLFFFLCLLHFQAMSSVLTEEIAGRERVPFLIAPAEVSRVTVSGSWASP